MSALAQLRRPLSRALGIDIGSRGRIALRIELGNRRHWIRLRETQGWIRVYGRVVHRRRLKRRAWRDLMLSVLAANESSDQVTFHQDGDYIVAVCDLPVGVPVEEVAAAVMRVARVADRWEEVWVGGDYE